MAKFSIDVRFGGGLNAAQQAAFRGAADRWAEVIVGDFPRIRINREIIEALVIDASGADIDRGAGRKATSWDNRHRLTFCRTACQPKE